MGLVVSIHSYRGGTGKSNLTANLAASAGLMGKRVGVIDTDLPSPGTHVLFGLADRPLTRTLNDYLHGTCGIADAAYAVAPPAVRAAGGDIRLVPASLDAGDIARVLKDGYDVGRLSDGFGELIEALRLDVLFVDTHPGMNEETLLSIAVSDAVVLLLRPDEQDFLGTAVTVEVARRLGARNLTLVLNKVLMSVDVPALARDTEAALGAPVGAVLPQTDDLLRLGSRGLIRMTQPDHLWSKGVAALAAQLLAAPPAGG